MSAQADDPPPEAGKLPTGRIARTARVGGLVTGQGLRWAGMRTANRVRSPERAAAARDERTAALVSELVDQLGQMRGAAMKVGQLISMVEFDGLPEDQRDELQAQARDAARRRPAGAVRRAREAHARGVRRAARARLLRVRRARVRRRVDRPGPPRDDARRRRRGREGPVPRGRRGGRDATCATRCCCCRWSSGSRPASTPRRWPPSCASGSARSSTTSSRRSTSGASSG